jgi:type VI secretion system secreted protein Hcp
MYFKFSNPDIAGGSHDSGHAGEIEVLSWNHSFVRPPSQPAGGSGTVEQASHSNFTFAKYPDSASADLLKYCWNGRQLGKALLSCYRSEGQGRVRYLEVELTQVIITNFGISGGPGDPPVENIALDYGVVTYRYFPQASGGAAQVSHDLIQRVVS